MSACARVSSTGGRMTTQYPTTAHVPTNVIRLVRLFMSMHLTAIANNQQRGALTYTCSSCIMYTVIRVIAQALGPMTSSSWGPCLLFSWCWMANSIFFVVANLLYRNYITSVLLVIPVCWIGVMTYIVTISCSCDTEMIVYIMQIPTAVRS